MDVTVTERESYVVYYLLCEEMLVDCARSNAYCLEVICFISNVNVVAYICYLYTSVIYRITVNKLFILFNGYVAPGGQRMGETKKSYRQ